MLETEYDEEPNNAFWVVWSQDEAAVLPEGNDLSPWGVASETRFVRVNGKMDALVSLESLADFFLQATPDRTRQTVKVCEPQLCNGAPFHQAKRSYHLMMGANI